jgi:serine/threonine protein phosphatase PrpC
MLEAQFFTDTGQHRDKNEDAGGIFYNQTNQQLLVLCDGMGGHFISFILLRNQFSA